MGELRKLISGADKVVLPAMYAGNSHHELHTSENYDIHISLTKPQEAGLLRVNVPTQKVSATYASIPDLKNDWKF